MSDGTDTQESATALVGTDLASDMVNVCRSAGRLLESLQPWQGQPQSIRQECVRLTLDLAQLANCVPADFWPIEGSAIDPESLHSLRVAPDAA